MSKKLSSTFYQNDTAIVAQNLLGKKLIRVLPNGKILSGIIVEVEAYLGIKDKACHTYAGKKTRRTQTMFMRGGHSYVYMIYGMYNCFNVVTRDEGVPEAVLIRALEPIDGIDEMKKFRNTTKLHNLCSGPGKLCDALKIDRNLDKHSLTQSPLWIEDIGIQVPNREIIKKPRIGVDYAGSHARWPLRFYIKNNPYISKV